MSNKFFENNEDILLKIRKEIYSTPEKFRPIGTMIDKFCLGDSYKQRRLEVFKHYLDCYADKLTKEERQEEAEQLNAINNNHPPLISRISELWSDIFRRFWMEGIIGQKESLAVLIIVWLSTDPEANYSNLNITEFQRWPWEPWGAEDEQEIYGLGRCILRDELFVRKDSPKFNRKIVSMIEQALKSISLTENKDQHGSLYDLNIHFSKKDRLLFLEIANSIKAEPNKYKQAGEWLDWFCFDEDKYWRAREIELRQCNTILSPTLPFDEGKKNPVYNINSNEKYQNRKSELEIILKEKAPPKYTDLLRDGWEVFFGKFSFDNFLNEEDSYVALLIAWLLTDPNADNVNLGITKFEDWPWSFIESGNTDPRSNAQRSLFKPDYQYPYDEKDYFKICMKLIHSAAVWLKHENKPFASINETSKEVKWSDDAPEFLPSSKAIKLTDKLSLSSLSKLLKPNGPIRYMRKSQRCKVHIQDFGDYIKTLSKDANFDELDEYQAGIEQRMEEERQKKTNS